MSSRSNSHKRRSEGNNAHVYTKEEARSLLNRRAHRRLGISGAEFLRRLDRGEIGDTSAEVSLAAFAELAR